MKKCLPITGPVMFFTLPSVYEPFGLVYLEAMAYNKPVVAPDDEPKKGYNGRGRTIL